MENNFLISVVLPVFNGEKFLSKSIESVLNQTYQNVELIIVNDNSTDNTLNIANQYAEKDSRVKIISNSINKKLPASLNIGHNASKGNFITWTSDDNFYELDTLKILLNNLLQNEADVVYSNFTLIDDKDQEIRKVTLPGIENLIFGNVISCCFMYKREVYQRNIRYNEDYFLIEDYDFWLRATLHSKFYQINEYLYNYRKHQESLTNQINVDEAKNILWKKNLKAMFLSFWENFAKNNYFEIAELSTKLLLHEKIDFDSIVANNDKIKEIKTKIKKNQNFSNELMVEKVFLQRTIGVMTNEKETKRNFLRSVFIIRNYRKVLDKNSVKTLIKYSFFK
ncbi:Glycosyl transferase family 2 [Flavobacterium resistens]|uniref:Glycosyl transferase family 2 n=1 Tax=Flavobacterium resistens TaxID=443612 RepID=A0A521ER77_9FLAO|nr:glycosyltransferase [Flavobacterium resistens]MRX67904.1 glycosyltransferase [Flavobacterium resistens]SMO86405.1 Glycosyl transferase family 2 [Flavobacterium resistens]